MSVIPVQLPAAASRGYEIRIEPGLLARLGAAVAKLADAPTAAVISDSHVGPLYGRRAVETLRAAGFSTELLTFTAGEPHKTLETCAALWDGLSRLRIERGSPVVALGGGVVGDVAGFVASAYLRGLPVVQVPTTLLACVDSSVGGKTGVNHPVAGKNMIGAFHQPIGVLIDPLGLGTLPPAEWCCGLAESVKHGVIRDAEFFAWLDDRADDLSQLAAAPADRIDAMAQRLAELIAANCRIKAAVVAADERESGLRAILNFGHTLGHAIETLAGYDRMRHGEAVSIGMMAEARIASARGLFAPAELDRLTRLLGRLGLPVAPPAGLDLARLLQLAGKDKKVRKGKVRFVLPTRIGATTIVDDVRADEIATALDVG